MVSAHSDDRLAAGGPSAFGPVRNVLLLGFMASGKTTVGEALAERVGWPFLDFDQEIVRHAGRSVARIFEDDGEEAFRDLEGRIGTSLLGRREVVLAAGGGWPTRPGRLEAVPHDTLTVWLKVSPEMVLRRAALQAGTRPLLEGGGVEPLARIRTLMHARESFYTPCRLHLDTDEASPDALAASIAEHL